MKMSKILLILVMGIISLNLIFAGTVSKTFLIKGDLVITPNLTAACASGTLGGDNPIIDELQVDAQKHNGPSLQAAKSNKENVLNLFFSGTTFQPKCKLEIYTPNNTSVPIYSQDNLTALGIKAKLNEGIVIGPINITSTSNTVNFYVKIKSNTQLNPTYQERLLTTIVVPNPNATQSKIYADYADESDVADRARELIGGGGTGSGSSTVLNPNSSLPPCNQNSNNDGQIITTGQGVLKVCRGQDNYGWIDLQELYSDTQNAPVIEPSIWDKTVTPVLMRYWNTSTNSWEIKWQRIDTHAIGPNGVIPEGDLTILNQPIDNGFLSWDKNSNQMVWKDISDLYESVVDVTGTSQPILVNNKFATIKLKSGENSYDTYLLPIYRVPLNFSISNIFKVNTQYVGSAARSVVGNYRVWLNTEGILGAQYEVKWYYKPSTGADIEITGCRQSFIDSNSYYGPGSGDIPMIYPFSTSGINNYTKLISCNWTPSNSTPLGLGQLYVQIKKIYSGNNSVVNSPETQVWMYNPMTNLSLTNATNCGNHYECVWDWQGISLVRTTSYRHTWVDARAQVSGGSGLYKWTFSLNSQFLEAWNTVKETTTTTPQASVYYNPGPSANITTWVKVKDLKTGQELSYNRQISGCSGATSVAWWNENGGC